MASTDEARARRRVLSFLRAENAQLVPGASPQVLILRRMDGTSIGMPREIIDGLSGCGLIMIADGWAKLTPEGRTAETRRRDLLAATPQMAEVTTIQTEQGPALVTVNAAESPLATLFRRRRHDGARYLSDAEFQAGERLRADYSRGQIMPRMGVNWSAAGRVIRQAGRHRRPDRCGAGCACAG